MKQALLIAIFTSLYFCSCTSTKPVLTVEKRAKAPWTHLNINDSDSTFHFAIVSDRTGGEKEGIFGEALRKVNLMQPAFVMSVGDIIEGYTENPQEVQRQWDMFDSLVSVLDMPFFRVAGNHDNRYDAARRFWEKEFGPAHYHFVYSNVLFLCLNTSVDGDTAVLDSTQIVYAKTTLESNTDVRWTFLFLHHPLWLYAYDSTRTAMWRQLTEALGQRPYTSFSGHFHYFIEGGGEKQKRYVIATTGAGAAPEATPQNTFHHFVWVTVKPDKPPYIASLLLDGVRDIDSILTDDDFADSLSATAQD